MHAEDMIMRRGHDIYGRDDFLRDKRSMYVLPWINVASADVDATRYMIGGMYTKALRIHSTSADILLSLDNPESDIAGANAAGWSSILVHTGVYSPSEGAPPHVPTFEASDVEEAVYKAISRERK